MSKKYYNSYSGYATLGVRFAIRNLRDFLRTLDTVPQTELENSAKIIKEKAIAQVPYEFGKLEKAIYVTVNTSKHKPGLSAGARAYSKDGFDYAGVQHDDESYNHPGLYSRSPDLARAAQGKAHYISDPFFDEIEDLKRRLRKELKMKHDR